MQTSRFGRFSHRTPRSYSSARLFSESRHTAVWLVLRGCAHPPQVVEGLAVTT
jgi:hypothetical protein